MEEEDSKLVDKRIILKEYFIIQEVEKIITKEEGYWNIIITKDILVYGKDQKEVIMVIMDFLVFKTMSIKQMYNKNGSMKILLKFGIMEELNRGIRRELSTFLRIRG